MTLDFGEHEDVVFGLAPLVTVLCQIRFPPILALLNIAGLTGIQTVLRGEYPVLLPNEPTIRIRTGPDAGGTNTPPPVWRLQDEGAKWILAVGVDFISLETPRYTSIEEFLSRLDRILEAIRRTLRPALSIRVGLRKINVFQPPDASQPYNYRGVLKAEALGLLSVEGFPALITEGSSQVQFTDGENSLVINSGLGRNGEGKIGYVLDMDYSTNRQFEVMNGEPLTSLLRDFSDGMTNFFHWALVDEYKSGLLPHPRSRTGN